jgi:hypothetical protein
MSFTNKTNNLDPYVKEPFDVHGSGLLVEDGTNQPNPFDTPTVPDSTNQTEGKEVFTFSALNTFRNCPRKYKHRYLDNLQPREQAETLAFGSVIHEALEQWYRAVNEANRLQSVLDFIDSQYPLRESDHQQKATWHLARAMLTAYAQRYAQEDFEIVAVEQDFTGDIRNPITGRSSQSFVMAGKADGIVRLGDELYLLEHKTASSIDANYLDKLWTDTQIALYCFYLRQKDYPIVGVIYNVLLKARLQQRQGETQEEYEARRAELAAKNKSGKSSAQRQLPESDDDFQARLADWYAKPEAFHRERIYLSEDRLQMLQEEVWEITQQCLHARRRGQWLLNTSYCFAYQRPCEYLAYCQSNFNPNVRDNLFDVATPHTELSSPADNPVNTF